VGTRLGLQARFAALLSSNLSLEKDEEEEGLICLSGGYSNSLSVWARQTLNAPQLYGYLPL